MKSNTSYGNQLISGTAYIHAITNNAVEYVNVYEDETLLATLTLEEHCTEVDYVRTFTGTIAKATEGKHTIRFEAYDSEGNMAKRSFTYYAVTDFTLDEVQYPISDGLKLLKYPDLSEVRKTLTISDALEVQGTYGELYFVKCGEENGYVSPDDVFSFAPSDRADIGLEITSPTEEIDYIGFESDNSTEHKIVLSWKHNDLPSDWYLIVGMVPVEASSESSQYLNKFSVESGITQLSFGLYELQGKGGWYDAVVRVYTPFNTI